MPTEPDILISIVSHRQGNLVAGLLDDLQAYCDRCYQVVVTVNVTDELPFDANSYDFPVHLIYNQSPKGYAANQNAAFRSYKSQYFCVINPDIRLKADPFPSLVNSVDLKQVGVTAPMVVNTKGEVEVSIRHFPTPVSILLKAFGLSGNHEYVIDTEPLSPDWVAGMFMLFPSKVFEKINGFDEKFFLYYEDVDICARLKLLRYDVAFCPEVSVIHDARRESHRNPRYLRWHLASISKYFFSKTFLKAVVLRKHLDYMSQPIPKDRNL